MVTVWVAQDRGNPAEELQVPSGMKFKDIKGKFNRPLWMSGCSEVGDSIVDMVITSPEHPVRNLSRTTNYQLH